MTRSPDRRATSICELDVIPDERLVFTRAGKGTKYRAHVMHRDSAAKSVHESMGYHAGWGAALDQLVAMFERGVA